MRMTATLNLHHLLKEGAIPPEVDGVPQILPSVGSPPIEMQIFEQTLFSAEAPSGIPLIKL